MKQEITFSRSIWDADSATMVARTFTVTIDTDKIKPTYLHKARRNKNGKAQVINGAVVIREAVT